MPLTSPKITPVSYPLQLIYLSFWKKKVEEEETGLRAKRGALGLDLVQHCQWDFSFPKVKGRGVLCALVLPWADSLSLQCLWLLLFASAAQSSEPCRLEGKPSKTVRRSGNSYHFSITFLNVITSVLLSPKYFFFNGICYTNVCVSVLFLFLI